MKANNIYKKFPSSDWYVTSFEIDSFSKGTTTSYMVAMKKTGQKNKFGGDIYSETERTYFILVAPNKYKKVTDPYKK